MIIDAHQHFWKIDRGDYGWMDGAGPTLRRDYLPGDLEPTLRRFGVSATVLVQAAPTTEETDFLLDLAEQHDFIAGVVGWVDLESETFRDDLARLMARPKFVGIRPMLQDLDDDRWILRPRVLAALEHLAAVDLALDILIFPRHLPYVVEALSGLHGLRAVLDHMGKPPVASGVMEPWRGGIAALAKMPNVHCKVSGLITEADHASWTVADMRPYVDHVVAEFGTERLMWGSDWPVCRLAGEYDDWLAAVRLMLPGNAQLFGANAARFYRLPSRPASASCPPNGVYVGAAQPLP